MTKAKKIVAVVQARIDSTRLKNKVLKKINGKYVILLLLERLSKSKKINDIVVAIPETKKNDHLNNILLKNGYKVFRGSENNVLSRYYEAALKYKINIVVRITGDCPLVDPRLVDKMVKKFKNSKLDYYSNIAPPTFPDGFDVEVFSFKTLKKTNFEAVSEHDKEHVTKYILRNNKFKKGNFLSSKDYSNLRVTLDENEDFILIKFIFNYFRKKFFYLENVINLYELNSDIFNINNNFIRNEKNSKISLGQKLWNKAKKNIAGGNMLFSKRPDVFLPGKWPSYFEKAKGCKVTDLDNKTYIDLCMSVGPNILGYSHSEIDKAVKTAVSKGNMTTLNCPEEVYLAEKLINLHPWAGMVRFARTGGEANAVAIRLARASVKKKNIAFCGYHGWHDWYLAANIKSTKNLSGHLLSGLNVDGVPNVLKKTIFPFRYNDFESLKKIVNKNNIGIIEMEVIRNIEPKNNFLKKVRNLATKNNIILIFDESTSGFRQTFGGIHKLYKINPDLMILGKALGNGYAITAVIGKKEIMQNIKNTFISSTFWTERIGPVAAMKTLEVMEKSKSWLKITKIGKHIMEQWRKLAKKHSLKIKIFGIPALCSFKFYGDKNLIYKTLITQEMLKKGFLANTMIYVSVAHTKKILKKYFLVLDNIFSLIKRCENGENVFNYLEVPVSESMFSRIN